MFPSEIMNLRDYLAEQALSWQMNHDGSAQDHSLQNEKVVIKKIKDYFVDYAGDYILDVPRSTKSWYDFRIISKNSPKDFFPWNVKITTSLGSNPDKRGDSACALIAMGFVFTNECADWFTETRGRSVYKNRVHMKLVNNKLDTGRDYGFLVLNKDEPSDIVINSLRYVNPVQVTDLSNLPFQIVWRDNRYPDFSRSFQESYETIMEVYCNGFKRSLDKVNAVYESISRWNSPIFRDEFIKF